MAMKIFRPSLGRIASPPGEIKASAIFLERSISHLHM
jgi:hypothetical protein